MNNKDKSSLDGELLNIIASQVKLTPYTIVMSMGIVAYMMYQHLPDRPELWGGWLALVVLSQAWRIYRLPRLPRETRIPAGRRVREAAAIHLVSNLILSLSLLAFPLFTPYEAAVQTITFIGFGVGSIVTAVGWAPYTLGHIGLTLLPMFSLWAWSGMYGPGGTLAILVAIVGFAYSLTMWFIGKRLFRMNEVFFANRAALAIALDEAEAAGMAKTRFLAAASHDLRQPIHTLSLFSGALGMSALDDRTRHISRNIDGAVKALSAQLDALLDVSKLDAGIVPVNLSSVDLRDVLLRLRAESEAEARAAGIQITVDCPAHAMASTDAGLLESLLRNLVINAITHNVDCELKLSVAHDDDHWLLTIRDSGSGIPVERHKQVFEEFYQVPGPEGERGKGLGLGLSIVKRLSRLLGLGMQFESRPGFGTRFQFSIPVDASGDQHAGPHSETAGPLEGLRVLVVDDEPSVQEGMKVLLEMLGCRVDLAESMEQALYAAREARPDIALVDYHLRGAHDGLETIRRLRQLRAGQPVILISGDTGPERLREARAAGIVLLSKPVGSDALREAVGDVLQEASTRADSR